MGYPFAFVKQRCAKGSIVSTSCSHPYTAALVHVNCTASAPLGYIAIVGLTPACRSIASAVGRSPRNAASHARTSYCVRLTNVDRFGSSAIRFSRRQAESASGRARKLSPSLMNNSAFSA